MQRLIETAGAYYPYSKTSATLEASILVLETSASGRIRDRFCDIKYVKSEYNSNLSNGYLQTSTQALCRLDYFRKYTREIQITRNIYVRNIKEKPEVRIKKIIVDAIMVVNRAPTLCSTAMVKHANTVYARRTGACKK